MREAAIGLGALAWLTIGVLLMAARRLPRAGAVERRSGVSLPKAGLFCAGVGLAGVTAWARLVLAPDGVVHNLLTVTTFAVIACLFLALIVASVRRTRDLSRRDGSAMDDLL